MNFYINQAMGLGNSGVEHAQFYRAKRFDQAGLPYRFVFLNLITELHRAMDRWNLRDDQVLNVWEYFTLGGDYLTKGLQSRIAESNELVADGSQTARKREIVTDSGMRIVHHYVKYPDIHAVENPMLLVQSGRTEIFNEKTGERRVMYEEIDDINRRYDIVNIHLFNENGKHLFFENRTQLFRYFFEQLDLAYGGHSNFIIDRGEDVDEGLMTNRIADSKIIYMVHADHLADRDDPKYPLWNDHYEYMFDHLDAVDRVVVATKLQRDDILIDFPGKDKNIVAIPVGGVHDDSAAPSDAPLGNPVRFITASRLAGEKHIDVAVEAIVRLHNAGKPVVLDIFGAGEEQGNLQKLIDDNQAGDYIALKGLSDQLEKEYPKYDAYISASFSEGFGLTYIEALDANLPVITFKARFGALEMIQDGENGFLQDFKREDAGDDTAHAFNVDSMTAGIKRLLASDYAALQARTKASVEPYRDSVIAKEWRNMIDAL